jgi:hypothetical protein
MRPAVQRKREHKKRKDAALRVDAAMRKDGKGRERKAKATPQGAPEWLAPCR